MADTLYIVKAPAYAYVNTSGDRVAIVTGGADIDIVLHQVATMILDECLIDMHSPEYVNNIGDGNGEVGLNLDKIKMQTTIWPMGSIPFPLKDAFLVEHAMDLLHFPEI